MDAKITVEFTMKNVCNRDDPQKLGLAFEEIVKDCIEFDFWGCVEDDFKITEIQEAPDE